MNYGYKSTNTDAAAEYRLMLFAGAAVLGPVKWVYWLLAQCKSMYLCIHRLHLR